MLDPTKILIATQCTPIELYQINQKYVLESSFGVMYNDPEFNIQWPLEITEISSKNLSYQPFNLSHEQ